MLYANYGNSGNFAQFEPGGNLIGTTYVPLDEFTSIWSISDGLANVENGRFASISQYGTGGLVSTLLPGSTVYPYSPVGGWNLKSPDSLYYVYKDGFSDSPYYEIRIRDKSGAESMLAHEVVDISVFTKGGASLEFDSANAIYMTNYDRVQKFDSNGVLEGDFIKYDLQAGVYLVAIKRDIFGNFYISDSNGGLRKVSSTGEDLGVVVDAPTLANQSFALDDAGNLFYVTSAGTIRERLVSGDDLLFASSQNGESFHYVVWGGELSAVPEPETMVLCLGGLIALGLFGSRRKLGRR